MKTPKPILFTAGLLFQFVIQAQIQWYQNQDGNNQPAGTYATKIESLTPHSFVAAYLWQRDNENYTWKISKSHINGAEQRTLFLSGPSAIAEIKTGYRNSVYVLFRSFPFAQDPQYTLYKLDSNLTIKAQRSIHFPNNFCIFNLNAFELDDAGNVYLAGDGQYPEGPGFSPASFIIKTDKHAREADPDFVGDPTAAYGGHLSKRSHGQGIMAMVRHALTSEFVLFDEPETALSPPAQLGVSALLMEWAEEDDGRQAIIATHSPLFMRIPRADIIELAPSGPRRIARSESASWSLYARATSVNDAAWEQWLRGVLAGE